MAATTLRLPAFTTAHSHVFQRAMRGLAQRPGPGGTDDFWSWRTAMYNLAASMTPERLSQVARVAYRELRLTGVLTVGEFHYLHHQPDGTPYAQRTLLADLLIDAARAEGLRIALLRAVYHRAGPGRPPEGAQRRFCDEELDMVFRDVEELQARYRGASDVRIGLAPHSVRAVPPSWLGPLAAFAAERGLPFHMHVAEQPGEVESCLAETGRRPVELLDQEGVLQLGAKMVAVHGTHLMPEEAARLGRQGCFVCINATTERDLGDGHPNLGALRKAGVRLCTGIDSYVMTDPFEEMRGIELGERLRTLQRVTERQETPTLAERLWAAASIEGAKSLGFEDAGGVVLLDLTHPTFALVDPEYLLDAAVFSAGPSVVKGVESEVPDDTQGRL
ncbi:MAG: formimidoylglutamate deiminase [Myxococcales bacterium]|nr:formimidoylglutamate deiminase [Polyangiaceae bacterium]MDW8248100.1 formimidoylglutamate deiminase [Myxococcales bacterium]